MEDDSPAERAGLERGDLIVAANGTDLESIDGLYAALDAVPPKGGELALTVLRGTDEREVSVSFEARPQSTVPEPEEAA